MTKQDKLLKKALNNPNDLAFADFETLLKQQGWVFKRQTGSHAIWHSPKGYRLVIQNKNGKAKSYQVKQFLVQVEVELT
jgi:predicted RNA binding protein YcfA (HicA-like mRNA interferase family)